MSRVGMKHLAGNYQGLAFGKGPTYVLYIPFMGHRVGLTLTVVFYGEADGAEVAPVVPPKEEKGMLEKMTENKTMIAGYAVPTALLIAGAAYFLFIREGAPMRLNPWINFGGHGSDVANIRWHRSAAKGKAAQKKLAKRADMKLAAWKERAKTKSYKYATKKRAKKAYTTKKDKNGRLMYYIGGKRVAKAAALGTTSKVANPRRRKNGTKKGMVRKTARRAYTRNGSVSPYNKFVGKQMRAGKSMKQAARAWRNR